MPNRYRLPMKLMELRASGIPAVLHKMLAGFPMVVTWPDGRQEHKFSLIELSAN